MLKLDEHLKRRSCREEGDSVDRSIDLEDVSQSVDVREVGRVLLVSLCALEAYR